jgi:hypothetical protein
MNSLDSRFTRSATRGKFNITGKDKKIAATAEIKSVTGGFVFKIQSEGMPELGSRPFRSQDEAFIGLVEHVRPSGLYLTPVSDAETESLDKQVHDARAKMNETDSTQSSRSEAFRKNGLQAPIQTQEQPHPRTIAPITPEETAVLETWKARGGFPYSTPFNDNQIHRYLRLNALPYTFGTLTAAVLALNVGHFENPATLNKRGHQFSKPEEYCQFSEQKRMVTFSEEKLSEATKLLAQTFGLGSSPAEEKVLSVLSTISKYAAELLAALKFYQQKAKSMSFGEMRAAAKRGKA